MYYLHILFWDVEVAVWSEASYFTLLGAAAVRYGFEPCYSRNIYNSQQRYLCCVAAVKSLPVHLIRVVINKFSLYRCGVG